MHIGDGDNAEPVTEQLCDWTHELRIENVPKEVLERAKHLILDGIACGLIGSHVPWSEHLAKAIGAFEPPGSCTVIGYKERFGPLAAAILNGSFIQATELDDYHSAAPLHSASVLLPALFAAVDNMKARDVKISGADFLLAAVVGFETGPRVGNALHGANMLSMGWHSGPIFGSPAAAAATSKLFDLRPREIESALGLACTQAGGLMAAQYEGMVKRVQHAFASRNGLFGAMLAREGYVGMKKIFERPYGGFLSMFSKGCERAPQYKPQEVVKDLGSLWHTNIIRVKLHACVGGCHGQIELLASMQAAHPERFATDSLKDITSIKVSLSEPVFAHCGWKTTRPLDATGGQMSAAYIGAVQLVDRQVLLSQFAASVLDREEVWDLVAKTECEHSVEFDKPHHACGARIQIQFSDGFSIEDALAMPKGFDPPVEDADIVEKWRKLASTVIDRERAQAIEDFILGIDQIEDMSALSDLLGKIARKALD
ncbi:hypothetical protein BDV96DRAFT_672944 [Lophiotrema nucula]|uniref:2-methylcitrate dehydratase PrpD n=1 Tax=Lophiotrema nucula TaxID=690887 RepID=A0A6A5YNR3_9PLEO|nr:hypothetical protein BDV96DRAFT_672944 [Lophiotrema nucula]